MRLKFTRKRVLILSVISGTVIMCISVCLVYLLPPRQRYSWENVNREICVRRNCLDGQRGRIQHDATSLCVPRYCTSFVHFIDYGQICLAKTCLLEAAKKANSSLKLCVSDNCITSAGTAEQLVDGNVCKTEDCVYTAHEIQDALNKRQDPCEDFYEFACGGFRRKKDIPEGWNSYSSSLMAEDKVSATLKELLEEDIRHADSDALQKAKTLYRTCRDEGRIEERSIQELKDLMNSRRIGVWPTLDSRWKDCSLDLEWRMALLNANGIDSFFKLVPEFKGVNGTLYGSVYVASPLVDGICDSEFEKEDGNLTDFAINITRKYRSAMNGILKLLDVPENVSDSDMQEFFLFDSKFCLASQPSREPKQPSQETSNMTLEDLSSIAPEINWNRWLAITFSELGLHHKLDNLTIYAYDVENSVAEIVELIHNTSARTLANYLSWKFVVHHLGYLKYSMSRVIRDYRSLFPKDLDIFMEAEPWSLRWKRCVRYVKKLMPVALIPAYMLKKSRPSKSVSREVNYVVTGIKRSYNETFKKIPFYITIIRTKYIKKVDRMKFRLLVPYADEKFYSEYYSRLGKLPPSFLESGIMIRKFYLMKLFEGVIDGANITDIKHVIALYDPFASNTLTDFRRNLTVFSFAALEAARIIPNHLRYLNYGSFGTAFATNIARGFIPTRNFGETTLLRVLTKWTNWPQPLLHYAQKRSNCFALKMRQHTHTRPHKKPNAFRNIVYDVVAENLGVNAALRAYQYYFKTNVSREIDLPGPGVEYSPDQLFFIRYAQTWCNTNSSAKSAERLKVNEVLRNTKDFSDAFVCSEGTFMNPNRKCPSLWS